ncbi:MAG: hypothetical protein HY703_01225 [Gemmatimonadetes bacterium]|nr:hypothetical protein [Gemmatimonadota bacterium]
MSEEGRRRLLIALARAEEAVVETHVRNALEVVSAIGDELPLDRALDVYLEALEPTEPRASIVARRVLARLESGQAAAARVRNSRRLRGLLGE